VSQEIVDAQAERVVARRQVIRDCDQVGEKKMDPRNVDQIDRRSQWLALKQLVLGVDASPWPVLRPPIFVFVTCLDSVLGGTGFVLLLALSSGVGATVWAVGHTARGLAYAPATITATMLAVWLYNLSYFRLWILSDTVCIALMTCSVTVLLDSLREADDRRLLVRAAILSTLAGLTQTYGMIPFIIICGVLTLARWWRSKRLTLTEHMFGAAAVLMTVMLVQSAWSSVILHGTQPDNFALLKLSLGMSNFYSNLWPVAFGAFVPLGLMMIGRSSNRRQKISEPSH